LRRLRRGAREGTAEDIHEQNARELDALVEKVGARFRDDVRAVQALPVVQPRVPQSAASAKDASDVLASKMARYPTPSVLPQPIVTALEKAPSKKWVTALAGLDVSVVDASWMAQLASLDRWDPWMHPPFDERPMFFEHVTAPSFADAERWCDVRLLQGLKGDAAKAGRDVDELVRLLLSTEDMMADFAAVRCLRHARTAWEHANEAGMDVGAWSPPDQGTVDKLERVLHGFHAFADPHVDPALADDVFTSFTLVPGRCSALLNEGMSLVEIESITGALYEAPRARMGRLLDATKDSCRLTPLREAWGKPDQKIVAVGMDAVCDLDVAEPVDCVLASIFAHIPGFRDLQAETFSVDPRSHLDTYQRLATQAR
jgi:hypothetical protein